MTVGKRALPLRLEMNFGEALEQFGRTAPIKIRPVSERVAADPQAAADRVEKRCKRLVKSSSNKHADPD